MRCVLMCLVFAATTLAAEKTIVVPKGKQVTISADEAIRIDPTAIAGSQIEIKVAGSLKVESIADVVQRVGGMNMIGSTQKSAQIVPTGKGNGKITITTTPPNGKPVVEVIDVTIK
jgi:hypothetical protein